MRKKLLNRLKTLFSWIVPVIRQIVTKKTFFSFSATTLACENVIFVPVFPSFFCCYISHTTLAKIWWKWVMKETTYRSRLSDLFSFLLAGKEWAPRSPRSDTCWLIRQCHTNTNLVYSYSSKEFRVRALFFSHTDVLSICLSCFLNRSPSFPHVLLSKFPDSHRNVRSSF